MNAFGSIGEPLVRWIVQMNVWTALVAALVLGLELLLVRRIGASWRSLLYAAVVLRLLVPTSLTAPIGLLPAPVPQARAAVEGPAGARPAAAIPAVFPSPAGPAPATAAAPVRDVLPIVVYALGTALLSGSWLRGRRRLDGIASEARPDRHVPVGEAAVPVLSHPTWGPGLVGLRHPRIVVPAPLLAGPETALAWVLRHEAAHLRRRDHLTLPLLQLAVIALWPILPLWLVLLRYRRLVEMACDEVAVAGEPRRRREYGELLLSFASGPASAPSFRPFQEVTMTRDVVSRIVELRHQRRLASRAQGLVVLPLALVSALLVGPRAIGAPPDPGTPAAGPAPRSCRDTAAAVVDQFRHLRLTSIQDAPEGLTVKVALQNTDPRDVAKVIATFKDSLDRFGFVVHQVRGLPLEAPAGGSPAFPYEFVVSCAPPEAKGGATAQALGVPCPAGPDADAQLRKWFDGRAASSPKIANVQVTKQGSEVRLSGDAGSVVAVSSLVGELEACASFSAVDLRSVRAVKDGTYAFEMVATLAR